MILILTPVHNAKERVEQMCECIDKYTTQPFLHVLVDDNSNSIDWREVHSSRRRVLKIYSDALEVAHKNQLGQAVQLGYDYATQKYFNGGNNFTYDHVFLIESDVMVQNRWDQNMIDESKELAARDMMWASLDCQSVDEEGKLTYPTVISIRLKDDDHFELMEYADFQCTLFNKEALPEFSGVKFSDAPSHFDILWSRKVREVTGRNHYRTKAVSVIHYPHSSRQPYM